LPARRWLGAKKMSRWIVAVAGAAIFWTLSVQGFVEKLNEVGLIHQLGLDFRTFFVALGAVFLMFPVIQMLFLAPLQDAMDARAKSLEGTYAEAESLKQHMQDLKAGYEQKLAASEAEAREKIQGAISEAQQMKDQIIGDARNQAEEIKKRTIEDLEREKAKALVDLRTHVVDLTLLATHRIIGHNLDETKQRKLISDFIDKAEVGR
jgi:F-type H+-transporting ATPase subunit b